MFKGDYMNYEYVIVTSIPVFIYKGVIYTNDTWMEDIKCQLGLWKTLNILCPVKKLKKKPYDLVIPDVKINFITFTKFTEFFALILNLFKKPCIIFEFAGTSNYGIIGFILSKLYNKKNPIFITFDSPLSILLKNNSNSLLKKILIIINIKIMTIIRYIAASSTMGLISVGDGIIDEFDSKRKFNNNYLVIPLTLFDENDIFNRDYTNSIKIKIACIDRLVPAKGVYELLNAFNQIKTELNNLELHIFGIGPQEELLKDFVINEKLDNKVTFHGHVNHEEIMEELKGIDILVNLTKVGDINRTMWEGAANGCAIIASDTNGVRSFFTNEINAMLVNPNDIEDVTRSLRILCENPEIRYEISKNALKLASKFTNQKVKIMRKNWILNQIKSKTN